MKSALLAKLELVVARAVALESGRNELIPLGDIAKTLIPRLPPDELRLSWLAAAFSPAVRLLLFPTS